MQHGAKIKRLRSDRGGEYTGQAFMDFLRQQGTERHLTTHDTPQHNRVTESLRRRLMEHVQAFLIQSGLPKFLWLKAANHAIWVKNQSLTKVLGNATPLECLIGQKLNLAGVPEWGQRVWVHTNSGTKLDRCGVPARWVSYDADSTHAHHIYWPETQKVSVERDIKFTEDAIIVRVTPSCPSKTPTPQQRSSPTPPPVTIEDIPDEDDRPPFQHDDNGESKVEVKRELRSGTPTPEAHRTTLWPETQPMRQSAHI